MWYEVEDKSWVNEKFLVFIDVDKKNELFAVMNDEYDNLKLTGRISPVPFPGKFVEVKNDN